MPEITGMNYERDVGKFQKRQSRLKSRLCTLVVEFNRKPNPHISSLSAPVGSLETLARFRGRISRNRTCP